MVSRFCQLDSFRQPSRNIAENFSSDVLDFEEELMLGGLENLYLLVLSKTFTVQ